MTTTSVNYTKLFKNVILWGWYSGFWALCALIWLFSVLR